MPGRDPVCNRRVRVFRRRAPAEGACNRCGYSLVGLKAETRVCPECGGAIREAKRIAPSGFDAVGEGE